MAKTAQYNTATLRPTEEQTPAHLTHETTFKFLFSPPSPSPSPSPSPIKHKVDKKQQNSTKKATMTKNDLPNMYSNYRPSNCSSCQTIHPVVHQMTAQFR
jgi:hypothetical protein